GQSVRSKLSGCPVCPFSRHVGTPPTGHKAEASPTGACCRRDFLDQSFTDQVVQDRLERGSAHRRGLTDFGFGRSVRVSSERLENLFAVLAARLLLLYLFFFLLRLQPPVRRVGSGNAGLHHLNVPLTAVWIALAALIDVDGP